MDSQDNQKLHFVLFPYMAQGHMIPMIDLARLLAERGVFITIVTTPLNAARFEPVLVRAAQAGLRIHLLQLRFPCAEAGLPEGIENVDMIHSPDLYLNFLKATSMFEEPVQRLFEELKPRPSCIISDFCLPYTGKVAEKFRIPKIVFHAVSCFYLLCLLNLHASKILDRVMSDSEYFVLPNMPEKVEFSKAQLLFLRDEQFEEISKNMREADAASYGVIVNSFEELELDFVREYRKARGGKIWCVGPLSLCNKNGLDKAQRGKKSSIDEIQCLSWLDSQAPSSVVYVCLGSLSKAPDAKLIELGLGLEESNRPFIWVIRDSNGIEEFEKWVSEDEFEERTKERGLLIRGWAPQILILSHPAIAAFLTHCGWNSTIEGVNAGVPLITLPLFGDQFCNEKLAVQTLKIGVRVRDKPLRAGEDDEESGILLKKQDVKNAIDKVMNKGEEGERRRQRARELAKMAEIAVEEGGSSYVNITALIKDLMHEFC